MNHKRETFCNEYIIDFNGTQAAIRAGYSTKTARSIAQENLTKPDIQQKISELIELRSKRTEVVQDRVLLEVARIAFNDPRKIFDIKGNLLPVNNWPDEIASAISSIKLTEVKDFDKDSNVETTIKEIKFWDKGRQLELAAKHLGMLAEKEKPTQLSSPIILTRVVSD